MQAVAQWLVKALVIPLIKSFSEWLLAVFKRKQKIKEINEQNQIKVEAYEQSQTNDTARDAFRDLP